MSRFAFFLCLCVLWSGRAQAQVENATGSISGRVVDLAGNAVPEAKVVALFDINHPLSVKAGTDGRFFMGDVKTGSVLILASKEADGYPDSMFSFYDTPQTDMSNHYIAVSKGQETRNVVLRIGPRCATLKFHVTDEKGAPIPVGLSFDRPDIPGPYLTSVPPTGTLLVPPVPFKMTIEAPGYKDWQYSSGIDHSEWVNLKSGETLDIIGQLQRQ